MGSVAHIYIAPQRGAPMERVESVEAVPNSGLKGDRYSEPKNRPAPDNEVTLIESENIEAFTTSEGLPLTPDMPRRNIVTRGVDLNALCGKRFRVGAAVFEGMRLCEPCRLFARRTHRAVLTFFVGKGGLRARIVTGGLIRSGDSVELERPGA